MVSAERRVARPGPIRGGSAAHALTLALLAIQCDLAVCGRNHRKISLASVRQRFALSEVAQEVPPAQPQRNWHHQLQRTPQQEEAMRRQLQEQQRRQEQQKLQLQHQRAQLPEERAQGQPQQPLAAAPAPPRGSGTSLSAPGTQPQQPRAAVPAPPRGNGTNLSVPRTQLQQPRAAVSAPPRGHGTSLSVPRPPAAAAAAPWPELPRGANVTQTVSWEGQNCSHYTRTCQHQKTCVTRRTERAECVARARATAPAARATAGARAKALAPPAAVASAPRTTPPARPQVHRHGRQVGRQRRSGPVARRNGRR